VESTQHISFWQFLAKLFYQKDNIFVEGLGCFVAKYNYSHIDPVSSLIFPSQKIFVLDKSTSAEDSFLALAISRDLIISIDRAKEVIKNQVRDFLETLNTQQRINIPGIGTFSQSNLGIDFIADESYNYFSGSFGLKSLKLAKPGDQLKVKRIVIEKDPESIAHNLDAHELQKESLKELRKLLEKKHVHEAKEIHKNKSKLFPIIATALTLVLILNVLVYMQKKPLVHLQETISNFELSAKYTAWIDSAKALVNFNSSDNTTKEPTSVEAEVEKPKQENKQSNEIVTPEIIDSPTEVAQTAIIENKEPVIEKENKVIVDEAKVSIEKPIVKESVKEIVKESVKAEKMAIESSSIKEVKSGYYIIAGAFKVEANAKKLCKKLKAEGFSTSQIIPHQPLDMVTFAYTNSSQEAEALLAKIKSEQNASAWIFVQQ